MATGGISIYDTGLPMTGNVYGGDGITGTNGLITTRPSKIGGGPDCTGCEPTVPYIMTLIEFVKILESFKTSIDKFFPSISIGAPLEAKFGARGTIDIRLIARTEWIKRYKDTYGKFDPTSELYISQLKDVFLSLGYDWRIDKWLCDWQPPGTGATGGTGDPTRSRPA